MGAGIYPQPQPDGAAVRSGAATGHDGFYHEAACYSSDDDFLAMVVPFLDGGVAAGEPTIIAVDERKASLVRSAARDLAGITFLSNADQYVRPVATIRSFRTVVADHLAAGVKQIRIVGEVPPLGLGIAWDGWARYESVINVAYHDFPLWTLCVYDRRNAPDHVLADVARTHSHVATADGGHSVNEAFQEPAAFLVGRPAPPVDPLEATSPTVELVDPLPSNARRAVADLGRRSNIGADALGDLATSVSEVVTNGLLHGRPPVVLRAWVVPERLVVTVTDAGSGPVDPFVGMVASSSGSPHGGFGLWLVHQLCDRVSMDSGDNGFTVRLVAGQDP